MSNSKTPPASLKVLTEAAEVIKDLKGAYASAVLFNNADYDGFVKLDALDKALKEVQSLFA